MHQPSETAIAIGITAKNIEGTVSQIQKVIGDNLVER